jgi:hypothetical protein
MADLEADRKPTIDTLLEGINSLRDEMRAGLRSIEAKFGRIEIRLDKIEAVALEARAETRELAIEFRRFREQLNLPA